MNTVHPDPSPAPTQTYGSDAVIRCKRRFAGAIDQMNDLRLITTDTEVKRMASVAITEMQTAQMWAVKALTAA